MHRNQPHGARARTLSAPVLWLPLPCMGSNRWWLTTDTCRSFWCIRKTLSPYPHTQLLLFYCTKTVRHASCLLPLAPTQKEGIHLQGGAGFLGECWRQASQSHMVLQTLLLQPAGRAARTVLPGPRHKASTNVPCPWERARCWHRTLWWAGEQQHRLVSKKM